MIVAVLTFVALTATLTHFALGEFKRGLPQTMYLAVGMMMERPRGHPSLPCCEDR